MRATKAEDEPTLAVYKPRRGEMPLWDFPEGTLCRREVAAYVVAHALGWPNVPPTILRDGPEGLGSVQTFVEFVPNEHYFTLAERFADVFRKVALFDVIVNNADRKGGHTLLGVRLGPLPHPGPAQAGPADGLPYPVDRTTLAFALGISIAAAYLTVTSGILALPDEIDDD